MAIPDKLLIFGATSAIAYEAEKLFAADNCSLYLCARDEAALGRISNDLIVRGAPRVECSSFDALNRESIQNVITDCLDKYPELDGLLIAHGDLPDQKMCESDVDEMKRTVEINFLSVAEMLTIIGPHFEKIGKGSIAVISSVAGDRGRQSNYVYGSAKGALSVFLSGLRQRLAKFSVNVLTIKPGFVDTPMTAEYRKGFLFVKPDVVGRGIYNAIKRGKGVVYVPWFWWWIMLIIRNIPDRIFNKIKL